jgi:pilus assembly protein CpaE
LGLTPSAIIPYDPQSFGLAQSNGQMVFEVAPKSKAVEAMFGLAESIVGKAKPTKSAKFTMPKLPFLSKK